MSAAEILNRAADIVSQPGAWTQGRTARDKDGAAVASHTPEAVCFCAIGAINRAAFEASTDWAGSDLAYAMLSRQLRSDMPEALGVATWNDTPGRTQDEVANLLRRAAKR